MPTAIVAPIPIGTLPGMSRRASAAAMRLTMSRLTQARIGAHPASGVSYVLSRTPTRLTPTPPGVSAP